ncbi:MAG TPA: hypothetical protein VID93_11290 [Acidimicrobiales bacterium]
MDRPGVLFRRSELTGALPEPLPGSLDGLLDLLRAVPRDLEGWAVAAAGSYVVGLDNLSGEAIVRRALYTDSGLSVVAFRRAVVVDATCRPRPGRAGRGWAPGRPGWPRRATR